MVDKEQEKGKKEEPEKEQEATPQEPVITAEQLEKAKKVSRNVFNDAIALLFDSDNRIKPLAQTKDMAFSLIVAAVFILLITIFNRAVFPFQWSGLKMFLSGVILYFAGALSIYIVIRFMAAKEALITEGLNIMSISFIPLIVALILAFIFGLAKAYEIALFLLYFGSIMSFILFYNAIRICYQITIRSSLYMIPIILTVIAIIVRILLQILF